MKKGSNREERPMLCCRVESTHAFAMLCYVLFCESNMSNFLKYVYLYLYLSLFLILRVCLCVLISLVYFTVLYVRMYDLARICWVQGAYVKMSCAEFPMI